MQGTVKKVQFRLDDALRRLLSRRAQMGLASYSFSGPQTLKHLVEGLRIPHTEVGTVEVNGRKVDLGYLAADADLITLRSPLPGFPSDHEPRFVLDGHLGTLTSGLRMLGFDSIYQNDTPDDELVEISINDGRILLTRDRRLLMRKVVSHGYLVRSGNGPQQLREVAHRFSLERWIRPFQRCIRCNTPLEFVKSSEVLPRLEPMTRRYFHKFHRCPGCGQIYWKGSHYDRMLQRIASLRQAG